MEFYVALIGLSGALIGSLSSILTIFIQTKINDKRERIKLIYHAAIEEHKTSLDSVKYLKGKAIIDPLITFVHWHSGILEMLEKGKLDLNSLRKLVDENEELEKFFEQFLPKDGK
jgi:hypothetical protein